MSDRTSVEKSTSDKRTAILEATLNLISERGFHDTPMSLIAKASGASTGIIYHYFASKEELADFREEMRQSFSDLQTSVDAYAKKADTYFQEMVVLAHKVDRLEKWINQIAKKVGIELQAWPPPLVANGQHQ